MEYGMEDRLKFGKHRGRRVRFVLDDDPSWLRWAAEEGALILDDEVSDALELAAPS